MKSNLYNKKNHFSPRNVEKYNSLYKDKRKNKDVLFHCELVYCLHLKQEMAKDYLNCEVVMKNLKEQYDFHLSRMKELVVN